MKAALYAHPDPGPARAQAVADAKAQLEGFLAQAKGWRARTALRRAIRWCEFAQKDHTKRSEAARLRRSRKATARKAAQNRASVRAAGNHWQRWTDAHDKLVMTATKTDAELGLLLGRTIKAIRARRVVLKATREAAA